MSAFVQGSQQTRAEAHWMSKQEKLHYFFASLVEQQPIYQQVSYHARLYKSPPGIRGWFHQGREAAAALAWPWCRTVRHHDAPHGPMPNTKFHNPAYKFCSYSRQKLHQSTRQKPYMVPPTAFIQAMLKEKPSRAWWPLPEQIPKLYRPAAAASFCFCIVHSPVRLSLLCQTYLSELISVKAIYLIFSIELFVSIKLICILPHLSGEGC